ncbi:MAG: isoleucine--tRNA ligase [Alphaproteobacteria bacterium]|nr:isoleucine--tRNA ligase [Alphaproteobacteria bacterium]
MTKQKHYPDVDANPNFPAIEKQVLEFWDKEQVFEKSVHDRKAKKDGKNNEFIFYDGPPFANGLPHYGHLLTGFVKDLVARYQTMKGKRVERRFGWDCHGLPAEMGAEKELGISGRAKITEYGIGKFNEFCRTSVMKYTQEWRDYVTRQARWVDFDNDYKTMDKNFMESVLWAFKQLYDKGWVYEAYRVMPYSWAAETPLSNFETKLDNSYRDRTDKAVYVGFELDSRHPLWPAGYTYYLVAWTTTPWTLPSNLGLAVSTKCNYAIHYIGKKAYIFADSANAALNPVLAKLLEEETGIEDAIPEIRIIEEGSELLGRTYKPLFPYFKDHPKSFRIIDGSSFIEEGSGTGVVHMAPGFGEDDQRACEDAGISVVCPVDEKGCYTDELFDIPGLSLKGLNVLEDTRKASDEPYDDKQLAKYGLANLRIVDYLKKQGSLIKQEDYTHSYPHCWRTDKPLIYRAMPSWYVKVTAFRDRAAELNKQINWIPEHIRDGQMGHMLATAPDWSISRNRFWGTPIPVWRSPSGKIKVFGSIAELEAASGQKINDLHRPYIDEIVIKEGGEEYHRVTDVFDCWFESGSMPFAQVHYPFENKEWFETHFPADFITEYVGQTRGWFNTLIILATALFEKPAFQNCICHGVVLDAETGLKYSKRLKNYKDPMEVIDQFGADALRWLMIASPVMRGQDLMVDPEGKFIRDVVRLHIKPIWNAYNFFTLYANADGVKAKLHYKSVNLMDRYILAKCREAVEKMGQGLDAYDTPTACGALSDFFEVLNNWYIRRNKERFWKAEHDADKQTAYDTLYTVLHTMCRAASPLLPLTAEAVYRGLTGGKESVHLADWPDVFGMAVEKHLITEMDRVRDVCNTALSVRNAVNIRVRQPLQSMTSYGFAALPAEFDDIIRDEINVKQVVWESDITAVAERKLKLNNQILGKRLPEKMKQIIPASKQGQWELKGGGAPFICGELLLPGEYELNLDPKPGVQGAAALSTNDALVVLDLTLTPELEREGIARDMVRMIQQARKDAGLDVSDRIALTLEVPEKLSGAVVQYGDYIKEQTLAATLDTSQAAGAKYHCENTLDGETVKIGISVAA